MILIDPSYHVVLTLHSIATVASVLPFGQVLHAVTGSHHEFVSRQVDVGSTEAVGSVAAAGSGRRSSPSVGGLGKGLAGNGEPGLDPDPVSGDSH